MFLKVLAVMLTAGMVVFAAAGFAIYQTGLAVVDVNDKVHGHRIIVPVPMLMVNTAMHFIPDHVMREAEVPDIEMKLAHAAADALMDCPDAMFVEVEKHDNKVLVEKKGDNLVVNVDTPDEKVYVRLPIRGVEKLMAKMVDR